MLLVHFTSKLFMHISKYDIHSVTIDTTIYDSPNGIQMARGTES